MSEETVTFIVKSETAMMCREPKKSWPQRDTALWLLAGAPDSQTLLLTCVCYCAAYLAGVRLGVCVCVCVCVCRELQLAYRRMPTLAQNRHTLLSSLQKRDGSVCVIRLGLPGLDAV
jgi:hypothetical protein